MSALDINAFATSDFDRKSLEGALDAWDEEPDRFYAAFFASPWELFEEHSPEEARYLARLHRSHPPPKSIDRGAVLNLLRWGLVERTASMSALGRRLVRATHRNAHRGVGRT